MKSTNEAQQAMHVPVPVSGKTSSSKPTWDLVSPSALATSAVSVFESVAESASETVSESISPSTFSTMQAPRILTGMTLAPLPRSLPRQWKEVAAAPDMRTRAGTTVPVPGTEISGTHWQASANGRAQTSNSEAAGKALNSGTSDETAVLPIADVTLHEALQKSHAEAYSQGHEAGYRDGKEEGYANGLELGKQEVLSAAVTARQALNASMLAEASDRKTRFENLLSGFREQAWRLRQEAEDDLLALCFEALCQIVGSHLNDPAMLRSQILTAMQKAAPDKLLQIRLHPVDLQLLEEHDRVEAGAKLWHGKAPRSAGGHGTVAPPRTMEFAGTAGIAAAPGLSRHAGMDARPDEIPVTAHGVDSAGHGPQDNRPAFLPGITLTADSSLTQGGCVIDTTQGCLDGRLEHQLIEFRRLLLHTRSVHGQGKRGELAAVTTSTCAEHIGVSANTSSDVNTGVCVRAGSTTGTGTGTGAAP